MPRQMRFALGVCLKGIGGLAPACGRCWVRRAKGSLQARWPIPISVH